MDNIAGTKAGPNRSGPGDTCRLDLSTADHAVATARDFTRRALARWRIGEPVGSDAVLVVCELVANAARHAGGPRELRLAHSPAAVRIEVTDAAAAPPLPRPPTGSRPGGYGLVVLRQLCHHWGSEPHPHGKTVWAECALEGGATGSGRARAAAR